MHFNCQDNCESIDTLTLQNVEAVLAILSFFQLFVPGDTESETKLQERRSKPERDSSQITKLKGLLFQTRKMSKSESSDCWSVEYRG